MPEHSDPPGEDAATEGQAAIASAAAAGVGTAAVPELSPAACAARLAELFPAVFSPGAAKPLKLRIQADIQERAPLTFTRKALSGFLHRHTTSTAYLRALVNSPQRIDLDGTPAGEVANEHREAASAELQRRRALHDERRATERNAQREAQRSAQREAARAEQSRQGAIGDGSAISPTQVIVSTDKRGTEVRAAPRPARHAQRAAHAAPRSERQPQRAVPTPTPTPTPTPAAAAAEPARRAPSVQDDSRREHQALLRAYESSTLTRRNFCALKGLTEAQLEAMLAQARADTTATAPAPAPAPAPASKPTPATNSPRGPMRDRSRT